MIFGHFKLLVDRLSKNDIKAHGNIDPLTSDQLVFINEGIFSILENWVRQGYQKKLTKSIKTLIRS